MPDHTEIEIGKAGENQNENKQKEEEEEAFDPRKHLPTKDEMRQSTVKSIAQGKLPTYYDNAVIIRHVLVRWENALYNWDKVLEQNAWIRKWMEAPYNQKVMEEEFERYIEFKIQRILKRIDNIANTCCRKVLGTIAKTVFPPSAPAAEVAGFVFDIMVLCCWIVCCDWWIGYLWRRYVVANWHYYIGKSYKTFNELVYKPSTLYDEEDLSIYDPYSSSAYKVANMYCLILMVAATLLLAGVSISFAAAFFLVTSNESPFVLYLQLLFGIVILSHAMLLLPWYCRLTF